MKGITLRFPSLWPREARENVLDFPTMASASLAADRLAQAMYYARSEAHGVPLTPWKQLARSEQRGFHEMAMRVIVALRPTPSERMMARLYRFCDRLAKEQERSAR